MRLSTKWFNLETNPIVERKAASSDNRRRLTEYQFMAQIMNEVNAFRLSIDTGNLQVRDYIYQLYTDRKRANHTVSTIVQQLSESIGEMAQYVEVLDKNDKEMPNHWATELLNRPSFGVTRSLLFQEIAVNYLLQGEAFVVGMPKLMKSNGAYSALFCIPSHIIDIKRTSAVAPPSYVPRNGMNSYLGGKVPEMNADNTLHIKTVNLDPDTLHGLSPLIAVLEQTAIVEKIIGRSNMVVSNGGVVTVISPQGDANGLEVQAPKERQDFIDKVKYNDNPKETAFLDYPVQFNRIGDTPNEMGIFQLWDKAELNICNPYNYPPDLLRGGATFNNIAESKKQKYQIVIPHLNKINEALSNFLGLTAEGVKLYLNTDKIEVLQPEAEKVLSAMVLAGTTTNERREYMGYEAIKEPQADMVQYPAGIAFMGEDMEPTNENEQTDETQSNQSATASR